MDFSMMTGEFGRWFTTAMPDLGQYQFGQRFTTICLYIILSKAVDMIIRRILLPIAIRTSFDVDEHFVRFVRSPAVLLFFSSASSMPSSLNRNSLRPGIRRCPI